MLKTLILSNAFMLTIASKLFNTLNLPRIAIHPKGELKYAKAFLRKTRIRAKKENYSIRIMSGSYLYNCSIAICGKNNKVIIGENCRLKDVEIHIEDEKNEVMIGKIQLLPVLHI